LENPHGTQEETARLDILAAPLITTQLPKQEETVSGKDVTLRVVVRGSPRPEAQWFFNDTPITSENTSYDEEKSEYQLLLKETSVATSEGTYRVVLKNDLGETESTPCVLTVLEPVKLTKIAPTTEVVDLKVGEAFEISVDVDGKEAPKVQLTKDAPLDIVQPLNDINVLMGQSGTFSFVCDAFPAPKVTWFMNDNELKNSTKHKIEAKQNVYILTVNKCENTDIGTYRAVIDNGIDKGEQTAKLNVGTKPTVVGKPTDAQVQIGQPARLQVQFAGQPLPDITWSRADGQPLGENVKIANDENGLAVLVFDSTILSDKGSYVAKATNIVGSVEQKINLDVKEIKPTIIRDLEAAINATKGEPMTLTIEATGNPKPTVRFFRGTDELVASEGQIELKESEDGQTFTATILSIQPNQQGDYTATVQNTGGMAKSKKCKVTVTKTPTFIRKPQDLTIADKSEAVFDCEIDAYPNAKVSWIRDGKPLTTKEGVEIQAQADKGLYTLRIPQVDTTKHMGTIICRAENAIGTTEHSLQLNVTTAPTLKAQLKDLEIVRGQDATFTIDVQGYPIPEIKWMRGNETLIELSDKYTWADDQHRQLIIHNVQVEDEDEYNVRIHNEFGEVTSKAKLSCLIPPSISPATIDDTLLQHGDEIEYQFEIEGRPQVDVTWLKNGKELKLNENPNYIFTSDKENNKESFKIIKADGDDQARYTLQIKNKAGKAEVNINTIVKANLQFTKTLSDVATQVGQPVAFSCECFGLPKPTLITWYFNDIEIKSSAKYKIESKYPLINLTINKTDLIDIGKYRVVITNGEQTIENQANLLVQTKPKLEGKPQDAQPIIEESARIQCKFSGSQPFNVTWLKNGEVLTLPNDNIEVISEADTGIQALVFKHVDIDDKASYTVQVANMVGQALNEGIEIANDENQGIAALVFNTTTMADKGAYLVKATNLVGSVEQKVNLDIKGWCLFLFIYLFIFANKHYYLEIKPTIIRDLEAAINATKGEPMTLTIEATGNGRP
ncbi:unnamed protein product, partial [Rotaria sordida]